MAGALAPSDQAAPSGLCGHRPVKVLLRVRLEEMLGRSKRIGDVFMSERMRPRPDLELGRPRSWAGSG